MINFKITGPESSSFTIVKPLGASLPIQLGETLEGLITDIQPSGAVTINVKGSYITAKTQLMLEKDMTAMFKVIDTPASGKELKLQFVGYKESPEQTKQKTADTPLGRAMEDLSQALAKSSDKIAPKVIENVLKTLPQNSSVLPKDIKQQIQALLQESLKSTGQNIQTKLSEFFKTQIPESTAQHPFVQNLKAELMLNMEKLFPTQVKSALQDTGVALESKLRVIADKPDVSVVKEALAEKTTLQRPSDLTTSIKGDLKAGLLKLQELLAVQEKETTAKTSKMSEQTISEIKTASKAVEGLLKDIETFQTLSKTTDSFYTFLPLDWKGLKEGEIAFKKGEEGQNGTPFSCRINLDLEDQGKLSTLILFHRDEFFVSFKTASPEFKNTLDKNSATLKDAFREKGMYLKGLTVLDFSDPSFGALENLESFDKLISVKA